MSDKEIINEIINKLKKISEEYNNETTLDVYLEIQFLLTDIDYMVINRKKVSKSVLLKSIIKSISN